MSVTDPLILMPDTLITPLADLPEPIRTQLRDQFGQESGYAVTQSYGRKSSTLVDDETAGLLREFTRPSTIVDVVLRYSGRRGLDPVRMLEEWFPTLRRCLDEGYLVDPGAEQARRLAATFAVGDRVAGGVVLRCVQALDDSEIYQLALDTGGLAALKVLRSRRPAAMATAFQREAAVLRHLDGADAPRLLGSGTAAGGNAWMLLEWCDGVPAGSAAAVLRRAPDGGSGLLALGRRMTQAYARLHASGVVHGDVHPGNLIVSPAGEVRIVDFGLARTPHGTGDPPRGAAPPYLAPDHARALLAGALPGPATAASDQFCLAAVLYELFTGHGYLDFSLDEREMLRQIAEDPPLPFTRVGRAPWPGVEEALRASLAKDPGDRLASVAELDRRLAAADRPGVGPAARPGPVVGVDQLLDTVLARARPDGSWFTGGLPTAPLVSVAYGTAGLAVALHHVASRRDDPELAALADEWALRAAAEAARDGAFEHPSYGLTDAITGPVTPYHRLSGIHAVQALVSHSLDNGPARQAALDRFVAESRQPGPNLDLVLGRSGTLLAAAILHEAIGGARHADLTGLTALGHDTMRDLWAELGALPPIAEGARQRYLGVAHGWAGFLLATLRWCGAAGVPPPAEAGERLTQLARFARPAGAGLRWPARNDGGTSLPGWCHGSAGYAHLWTSAHAAFRDDHWADLAERAAWDAYLTPGVAHLCCGLAGQAYALLELYRHTGERRWLTAATELAVRAAADLTEALDGAAPDGPGPDSAYIPGSLHKGELGVAALAADLARPETASMPFFGRMC